MKAGLTDLNKNSHPLKDIMKHSPWGAVQDIKEYATGIQFVTTAGHGGFKLDKKRNASMPEPFRNKGGWYEEDCEAGKVLMVFKDVFPKEHEAGVKTVKNWFPDEYEKVTGEKLTAEESYIRAEQEFRENTKDKLVVISAWGSWHKDVPKGMVGCMATVGAERNFDNARYFLVPEAEYGSRNHFGFVIDVHKHREVFTKF